MFTFYEVGGKVRDEFLGLKSKDLDYVAVPHPDYYSPSIKMETLFQLLENQLVNQGFQIFLRTPKMFTIRAKNPSTKETSDFVIARKEVGYIPNTREPICVPGTLLDDLTRRDFTMNAIAKAQDGTIIDPFDGQKAIRDRFLQTPLPTIQTFSDDPLRILRAIRFSVTKGFVMSEEIISAIHSFDYDHRFGVVSEERIREELYKCLHSSTLRTLEYLQDFYNLRWYIFIHTKLWLKPTNES